MVESDKRQIILIRGPSVESDYGDLKFIETVTDWDDVTNEEFDILYGMQYRYDFKIVERNPKHTYPSLAGLRTPRDYIDQYRKDAAAAEERSAKRKKRDEATKLERKKRQLERLKKELEWKS